MFINLPQKISSFEILEWEVIEFEYFEISFNKPWVLILLKFGLCDFTIEIS